MGLGRATHILTALFCTRWFLSTLIGWSFLGCRFFIHHHMVPIQENAFLTRKPAGLVSNWIHYNSKGPWAITKRSLGGTVGRRHEYA